ncbi:hypothetical protein GCM10010230_03030 [Streptomyces narbonensis]|nr:hypothetical protein GCM10010230_03030 [Streptomyces narbonensis]
MARDLREGGPPGGIGQQALRLDPPHERPPLPRTVPGELTPRLTTHASTLPPPGPPGEPPYGYRPRGPRASPRTGTGPKPPDLGRGI